MYRICVFCGSSFGVQPAYLTAARELGVTMARRGLGLVYGGSCVGLMGAVADAALAEGAEVIGVIPQTLVDREVAHCGLSQLHITADMHERKRMMADLSNAFIALPGGPGTLEEFFEVLAWAKLGLHNRPVGLLNTNGYFDHLLTFLDHVVDQQFAGAEHRALIHVHESADLLLDACDRREAKVFG